MEGTDGEREAARGSGVPVVDPPAATTTEEFSLERTGGPRVLAPAVADELGIDGAAVVGGIGAVVVVVVLEAVKFGVWVVVRGSASECERERESGALG